MSEIDEARETNRRLNRRVQELEGPLQSLIGKAQHEVQKAQAATSVAQHQVTHINGHWSRELDRIAESQHTAFILFCIAAFWFFWAVIATVVAILR